MRHALTIDVEEYFQVHAFSGVIPPSSWGNYSSAVTENTHRILDLLDERRISATFFCLGWIAERNRELIKSIHARGHEIACHGYLHQIISNQDPATFREDVARAKGVLEDCTGESVIGYRAPTYSITSSTLWALGILEDLGFRYDSSIFPIYHDNYGIPDAPRIPHRLDGSSMVEFPISTLKVGSVNLPVSGGGYFRLLPYFITRTALNHIQRQGEPFVFYIHPWELNPETPRVSQAPPLSRFRTYTGINHSFARFRRLLQDFDFTTVREVLKGCGLAEAACC
jgi:polysaccharide deacetylase family protein (PEP-CTERM system associated)